MTKKIWNELSQQERLTLLHRCKTAMGENIMQHESTLDWDKLWPMRQDELIACDSVAAARGPSKQD